MITTHTVKGADTRTAPARSENERQYRNRTPYTAVRQRGVCRRFLATAGWQPMIAVAETTSPSPGASSVVKLRECRRKQQPLPGG